MNITQGKYGKYKNLKGAVTRIDSTTGTVVRGAFKKTTRAPTAQEIIDEVI